MKLFTALVTIFALLTPYVSFAATQSLDLEASSNQYASRADDADLDFSTSLTMEGWFKFESLPSVIDTLIAKYDVGTNNRSYHFFLQNDSGYKLRVNLSSNGSSAEQETVAFTPSTDTWYHLAVTYSNADDVKFYVNGVQQGTTQTTSIASLLNGTAPFAIGAVTDSGSPLFTHDGEAFLVRVWSDIRTVSEINDNKCTEFGSASNLVSEWILDGDYTDNAGDNDLTAQNSPVFVTDIPSECVVAIVDTQNTLFNFGGI